MESLIIGGTSFVGGRLVERLRAEGDHITLLNRGRSAPPRTDLGQLVADRRDIASMRAALDGRVWDRVFDVSGYIMATGAEDFDALIELLDGRTGRYVFVSSIMSYEPSGVFPWTETQPLRTEPPTSYGGFKAYAERALLARHRRTGFAAAIARPAAIYGPGNNILDMEAAMFHRLRRGLPVLVPHGGLVATPYGHVDDLCDALLALATHPDAPGEAFNITAEAVTATQYVETLAEIVRADADIVAVSDERLPGLTGPAFGHLFRARHHAVADYTKAARRLGVEPAFDFVSGHRDTYDWFLASPLADLDRTATDPVWGAGFDFAYEESVAAACRVPS